MMWINYSHQNRLSHQHFRDVRGSHRWRVFFPLVMVGVLAAIALGLTVVIVVVGGFVLLGLGAIIVGGLLLGVFWRSARRSPIWLHALADTNKFVFSLAFPLPLSLIRRGLQSIATSNETFELVRGFLEYPDLLERLHHDAIEIQITETSGDHVEVIIGERRPHWRVFQFKMIRSFSQTDTYHHQEAVPHD